MAFAQLTYRESLRDIETCLSVHASKLYHMGFRQPVRRSTLADANERRDWRIHAALAQRLITQARTLYVERTGVGHQYRLRTRNRSVPVGLSVGALPHHQGGGEDAHAGPGGNIPSFISRMASCTTFMPSICLAGSRSHLRRGSRLRRFARLYVAPSRGLLRRASNIDAHRVSAPTDRSIICDQTISLDGVRLPRTSAAHRFKDPESGKTLSTICALPLEVELFFKWIKQHLRIKQFYGTSENAVKTQIWIAVSVYVLVAIVKKRLDLDASRYTLLQIISVTLFEKMPIHQALAGDENRCNASQITNQLNLFDF